MKTTERPIQRTRGASRDFSAEAREQRQHREQTGYRESYATGTARASVLDATGYHGDTHVVEKPSRSANFLRRSIPKPQSGRLGSQQVVSQRGRRLSTGPAASRVTRMASLATIFMILGVVAAMTLSAGSTQQTFHLQKLQAQENQLDNQLETLRRDLELQRSAASLVKFASEQGLVVPLQPGVLEVTPDGQVNEIRPPGPKTMPLQDLGHAGSRVHVASSDPVRTAEISGSLSAIPEGHAEVPSHSDYSQLPYGATAGHGAPAGQNGQEPAAAQVVPAEADAPAHEVAAQNHDEAGESVAEGQAAEAR